jgi:putative membrane protein
MKFNQVRSILLGTTILSPGLLCAQFDPTATSASPTQSQTQSPTQPGRPQQQSSHAQQDSGPNAGDVGQVMQDKMFLRKAAEGGIAEVKLGQLAAQKASSDDVKAFGQKMVEDHTKLNLEIAQVADSMGVMLPKSMNKEDQAEYDKLNALSGNDFDIEYLTFMVKDHHKDLHEFRMEAASPADAALHNEVVKAQVVIHDHTVMVDKLARAKGIPMPTYGGHKPNPAPTL